MLSATLPGHSSDRAASVAVAHVLDDAHGGLEGGGLAPTRFPTMLTGVHPSPGPSVTSAHACGPTAGERCRTGVNETKLSPGPHTRPGAPAGRLEVAVSRGGVRICAHRRVAPSHAFEYCAPPFTTGRERT